jgi:hypothetical protein
LLQPELACEEDAFVKSLDAPTEPGLDRPARKSHAETNKAA